MVTRREVVTSGAIGALSSAALGGAMTTPAEGGQSSNSDAAIVAMLNQVVARLQEIERPLDIAHTQNTLAFGTVVRLREQFTQFVRANFKFPDYCEIGLAVFYDLYDWHVKHGQALQFAQYQNRLTIRFMFTQLILRPEVDPNYIGDAFDPTRPS